MVKKQNKKNTCLPTVNKYLHLLPWVDCTIVELSLKKKEFRYQDVFYIKLSCFVLSLDASACLGNKILPEMYSKILHLPEQIIKKYAWRTSHLYNSLKQEENMAFWKQTKSKYSCSGSPAFKSGSWKLRFS